ncbi:TetR family transcriptional regulator [Bdellovibrionota bacterium FG-2]
MGTPNKEKKAKKAAYDPIFFSLFTLSPRKGDLKRYAIIEAAIHSFAKDGIENTSFDSIGARLKIGRSHVAYYYPTRDEILEAVIQFITATAQNVIIERLTGTSNWREQLSAYVEGNFIWGEKYPEHAEVMLLFQYLCTHNKRWRDLHAKIRESGRKRIKSLLLSGIDSRELPNIDVEQWSEMIQSWVTGGLIEMTIGPPGQATAERGKKTAQLVLELLGHAVQPS